MHSLLEYQDKDTVISKHNEPQQTLPQPNWVEI
jgi:hypothetical protein